MAGDDTGNGIRVGWGDKALVVRGTIVGVSLFMALLVVGVGYLYRQAEESRRSIEAKMVEQDKDHKTIVDLTKDQLRLAEQAIEQQMILNYLLSLPVEARPSIAAPPGLTKYLMPREPARYHDPRPSPRPGPRPEEAR